MAENRTTLRLLLPAMLLPALVVLSDEAVVRLGANYRWSTIAGLAAFSWFVFQTALLSYVAGWMLPNWPWRLLLLGWTLVLVNLLLAASLLDSGWRQQMLGFAFLSGQICSLAIWLVLGGGTWIRRLALIVPAILPAMFLGHSLRFQWGFVRSSVDVWTIIVSAQVAGACALAVLLRLAGYRIEPYCEAAARGPGGPIQFSIRHLLIATTAVAIMVPVVQRMLEASSTALGPWQWLHASADGAVLALVSLAALWAALGAGRWPLKSFVFVVLALSGGAGLSWLEMSINYRSRWGFPFHLTELGLRWPAWTVLTASFLASMLLVLRGSGFRLMKKARERHAT